MTSKLMILTRMAPLLAGLAFGARTTEPDAAARKAILEGLKDAAVHYAERLQDFLCIELVKRSKEDPSIFRRWEVLETQEREVSYVAHREHYRVLKVNGKPPDAVKIKPGYFIPFGEFGTALGYIFASESAAEFEWDHMEQSGGRRLCVFRYRVTTAESTMIMQADNDRLNMQHRGLVSADCETALPMRIQIEAEPAHVVRDGRKIPLGWKIDIRYAITAITGKEFLLPQTSEETVRFGATQTRAEIQFEKYRKYESNSTVTFGDGEVH